MSNPHRLSLHPGQAEVYNDTHRFRVVCAARRFGKTTLSMVEMIRAAKKPNSKIMYTAPTYRQARAVVWEPLQRMIPKQWIKSIHDTRLEITLVNKSIIALRGCDNFDALRGVGLNFLVMDEYASTHPDAFPLVLRPTLSTTNGHALFIGTPSGRGGFFKLYQNGEDPKMDDWASWSFRTIDSPFVSYAEVEAAKRDLDEKQFAQEYLAVFQDAGGKVLHAFDRKIHVGNYKFNPNLPIWVGVDFNIAPMSVSILQPQPNGGVWYVDEVVRFDSNVEDICDVLESKFWRWMNKVTIYPDASGASRQHARGESSFQVFRERGFKNIKAYRKNPYVIDRINAMNRMLKDAAGNIRAHVDKSCVRTIESFEQTVYRENSNDIDKRFGTEHVFDAASYPISYEFPVRKHVITGLSM